jgi:protein-S-isoprenylcysteine O-methyltransferase Ste14
MKNPDLLLWAGGAWLLWSAYWFIAARSVNAARSSEGLALRATHLLPALVGFFLIFDAHPFIYGRMYHSQSIRIAGFALVLAGLLFAVWARIHLGKYWSGIITLKEGHELIRTGPYRFVRHPLYTGFLAAVVASAVVAATGDALVGCVVILVAYLIKIHREESVLLREFGEKYQQYKSDVSALVPFLY